MTVPSSVDFGCGIGFALGATTFTAGNSPRAWIIDKLVTSSDITPSVTPTPFTLVSCMYLSTFMIVIPLPSIAEDPLVANALVTPLVVGSERGKIGGCRL